MADYQKRMADQIRKEREKRGWRREDLAQKTGASYRQIERWETGKSRPQIANRMALAEVFELPLDELFPDLEAEEEALRQQLDRLEGEVRGVTTELAGLEMRLMKRLDQLARAQRGGSAGKGKKSQPGS